jgi:hypothetical protein
MWDFKHTSTRITVIHDNFAEVIDTYTLHMAFSPE